MPVSFYKVIAYLLLSFSQIVMADESYGDLSARIDDLEKKVGGQGPNGADFATKDDLETLVAQIKELRGRIEILEHGKSPSTLQPSPLSEQDSLTPPVPLREESPDPGISGVDESSEGDVEAIIKDLGTSAPAAKATKKAEKEAPTGVLGASKSASTQSTAPIENTKPAVTPKKSVADYAADYKANPKGAKAATALLGMATVMKDSKKACVVLKKLQTDFANQKATMTKAQKLSEKYKCG